MNKLLQKPKHKTVNPYKVELITAIVALMLTTLTLGYWVAITL